MSSGIMESIRKFFTMESDELDFSSAESMEYKNAIGDSMVYKEDYMAKQPVMSMPKNVNRRQEIVVFQPSTLNEAQQIAEHIKAHKAVVLNMKRADKELGKRIIDFLSGINYAVDGRVQKVADNIFICAPSHIDVTIVDDTDISMGEEALFA
ncbi:MAG: cell division protein SepF [Vulcanimicrobiota bacterium]